MALKLFGFRKQFVMDIFLLKLTQFEKTFSLRKLFQYVELLFRWEI